MTNLEDWMSRKWVVGFALVAALAVPVAGWAHAGHTHKALGSVSSVQGNHVEIKTTDGKVVTIMIDQKTEITRGTAKLDRSAIVKGERVSIDAMQDKSMMMASTIKLGTAQAAK